jgi:hypothetical protein
MPQLQKNTQEIKLRRERLRHSVILLIFLDLITLGLYSAARCYFVHAELSEQKARTLFSPAFLHIQLVLNLLLAILCFSREGLAWDAAVMMAQFGSALLTITLLLIFKRALHEEFKIHLHPLPLAIFGFWHLQHQINRGQEQAVTQDESWMVPASVVLLSLVTRMALITAPWVIR